MAYSMLEELKKQLQQQNQVVKSPPIQMPKSPDLDPIKSVSIQSPKVEAPKIETPKTTAATLPKNRSAASFGSLGALTQPKQTTTQRVSPRLGDSTTLGNIRRAVGQPVSEDLGRYLGGKAVQGIKNAGRGIANAAQASFQGYLGNADKYGSNYRQGNNPLPESVYGRVQTNTSLPVPAGQEVVYANGVPMLKSSPLVQQEAEENEAAVRRGIADRMARAAQEAMDLENRYNVTDAERVVGSAVESAAGMLPAIAAGLLPGGQVTAPAIMAASTGGQAAAEALADGATLDQAQSYGIAAGLTEAGVERLVGGIPGLGDGRLNVGGLADRIPNEYLSGAARRIVESLGEGAEEAITEAANPYLQRLIYNPEAELATPEEIQRAAMMGTALGGILGAAGDLAGMARDYRADATADYAESMGLPTVEANILPMTVQAQMESANMTPDGAQPSYIAPEVPVAADLQDSAQQAKEASVSRTKAQQYQARREREAAERIADLLGIDNRTRRAEILPAVRELAAEIRNGNMDAAAAQDQLFDYAYSLGRSVDDRAAVEYAPLREEIRGTVFRLNERDRADLGDAREFFRENKGVLRTGENGIPVDTKYQELNERFPDLFPEEITHPADQLRRIAEVARDIEPRQLSFAEAMGDEEPEFREYARNEYNKAMEDLAGQLGLVNRYETSRRRPEGEPRTIGLEEIRFLRDEQRRLQREVDRVERDNLLTDADRYWRDGLLNGAISPASLPTDKNLNINGILRSYEARKPLEDVKRQAAQYQRQAREDREMMADYLLQGLETWQDKKTGFQHARETMERNVQDIVKDPAKAAEINEAYFEPIHRNEASSTRYRREIVDRVQQLEIGQKEKYTIPTTDGNGTRVSESFMVQWLGEARAKARQLERRMENGRGTAGDQAALADLQAKIGEYEGIVGADLPKINRAIDTFADIYADLWERQAEALVAAGYEEPGRIEDGYFPHFQDDAADGIMGRLAQMMGMDIRKDNLPTEIAGLTHTFRPGKKWSPFLKQRKGDKTEYDALKGLDQYLSNAADIIFHTDDIQNLRALENRIRYNTSDEGIQRQADEIMGNPNLGELERQSRLEKLYENNRSHLSNFVVNLRNYTDNLAGKKSISDRDWEQKIGRQVYGTMKAIEGRVAANMVGVNPGSWITNVIPITQLTGEVSTGNIARALAWEMDAALGNERADFRNDSTFLTNRYGVDQLSKTLGRKVSDAAGAPMELIDHFTADVVVRAKYLQNLQDGMEHSEAIRNADAYAASLMADRSKGATPVVFQERNPVAKAFTMFQLEVNNQLSYLFKDLPRAMKARGKGAASLAWGLTKIFLAGYAYNELYEKVTGRRAALDPIDTISNAIDKAAEGELYEAGAGVAGDVLENTPFLGGLLGGGRLPISSALPDVPQILKYGEGMVTGDVDPAAGWMKIGQELAGPAAYLALPFGGGALKKAVEGEELIRKGGSYYLNNEGEEELRFAGPQGPLQTAQALVFGQYSLPQAVEYVEGGFKRYNADVTAGYRQTIENGGNGAEYLETYEAVRGLPSVTNADGQTIGNSKTLAQRNYIDSLEIPEEEKKIMYQSFGLSEKVANMTEAQAALGYAATQRLESVPSDKAMEAYDLLAARGVTPDQYLDALGMVKEREMSALEKRIFAQSLITTPGPEREALYDAFGLPKDGGAESARSLTDSQAAVAFACEQAGGSKPSTAILDAYGAVEGLGITPQQYAGTVVQLQGVKSLKYSSGKTITNSSSLQKRAYIDALTDNPQARAALYEAFDVSKTVKAMSDAEAYGTLNRYLGR